MTFHLVELLNKYMLGDLSIANYVIKFAHEVLTITYLNSYLI